MVTVNGITIVTQLIELYRSTRVITRKTDRGRATSDKHVAAAGHMGGALARDARVLFNRPPNFRCVESDAHVEFPRKFFNNSTSDAARGIIKKCYSTDDNRLIRGEYKSALWKFIEFSGLIPSLPGFDFIRKFNLFRQLRAICLDPRIFERFYI